MKLKRVLVGLKEPSHADHLIWLACRMAEGTQATITAVHITEIPEATPLDSDAPSIVGEEQDVRQAAQKAIRRHSRRRKIELKFYRARTAGKTLIEEIEDIGADLAVVGYHHKRSLREILLGSTAQYVSRHAACSVLVSIPPRG
ncbi:MAG TPA: universal stress protein [Candidatus Acidoferrales bacterium]